MMLVMMPYVVLCIYAIFWDKNFNIDKLSETKPVEISSLFALFNVVFWNMNGFDSASTFAGEVHRPKHT